MKTLKGGTLCTTEDHKIRSLEIVAEPAPIKLDEHGVARVGGTRVTLDTIVGAFLLGGSAESIADQYDAVNLADVYAVIAFYLRQREAVDQYLDQRRRDRNDLRTEIEKRFDPASFRARLLAREQFRG